MTVVGAVISKVLTRHQSQTIVETNRIAVAERSASVFTALNQQLVEFQQISRSKEHDDKDEAEYDRLTRRFVNAELRFNFLLETIQKLLRNPEIAPATKTKILTALGNAVAEYDAASKACGSSVNSSTSISQLLNICQGECDGDGAKLPNKPSIDDIIKFLNS